MTWNPQHDLAGRTALSSMTATGALTLATKLAVNERRPNGRDYGYPSGHTLDELALATSLHSSHGRKVSVPVSLMAGPVAFQRLDSGAHDLDDVLVGAAFGLIVSQQVHRERGLEFLGAEVTPFVDSDQGGGGVSLTW